MIERPIVKESKPAKKGGRSGYSKVFERAKDKTDPELADSLRSYERGRKTVGRLTRGLAAVALIGSLILGYIWLRKVQSAGETPNAEVPAQVEPRENRKETQKFDYEELLKEEAKPTEPEIRISDSLVPYMKFGPTFGYEKYFRYITSEDKVWLYHPEERYRIADYYVGEETIKIKILYGAYPGKNLNDTERINGEIVEINKSTGEVIKRSRGNFTKEEVEGKEEVLGDIVYPIDGDHRLVVHNGIIRSVREEVVLWSYNIGKSIPNGIIIANKNRLDAYGFNKWMASGVFNLGAQEFGTTWNGDGALLIFNGRFIEVLDKTNGKLVYKREVQEHLTEDSNIRRVPWTPQIPLISEGMMLVGPWTWEVQSPGRSYYGKEFIALSFCGNELFRVKPEYVMEPRNIEWYLEPKSIVAIDLTRERVVLLSPLEIASFRIPKVFLMPYRSVVDWGRFREPLRVNEERKIGQTWDTAPPKTELQKTTPPKPIRRYRTPEKKPDFDDEKAVPAEDKPDFS